MFFDVSSKYGISKRTCCFVGEECFIERRYAREMKEEQLEVVVVFCFCLEVTVLPFFLLDFGRVSAILLSSC